MFTVYNAEHNWSGRQSGRAHGLGHACVGLTLGCLSQNVRDCTCSRSATSCVPPAFGLIQTSSPLCVRQQGMPITDNAHASYGFSGWYSCFWTDLYVFATPRCALESEILRTKCCANAFCRRSCPVLPVRTHCARNGRLVTCHNT